MALLLIPLTPHTTVGEIAALADGDICVCDSYVHGAEHWSVVPGGWARDRFVNVDHHAPGARMARQVSSANLAIERVAAGGTAPGTVVITHTDCDSILSGGIISGMLEPRPEYGVAAIAADHTGAEDPIADLLQALDDRRDVAMSFESLARLERNEPQPREVQERLRRRQQARAAAVRQVDAGAVQVEGGLATAVFDAPLDGEFFPALLPDAAIIVLCSPWPDEPGRWEVKVRLGAAASPGMTLDVLEWTAIDPVQLGRWNARSNKRGGGTTLSPDAYLEAVRTAWWQFVQRFDHET